MKMIMLALAASSLLGAAMPDPKGKVIGNPGAPIRLELYEDFACPTCRVAHENFLPQLVKDYVTPGKAYIVFRDYVLRIPGHEYSRDAAKYAAAAARIGKYQAATDAIFRTQQLWAPTGQVWQNIASAFTPEEQKRIQALFKDPGIEKDVQDDIEAGNMLPLQQTPTLLIIAKGKKQPWTVWSSYPLLKSYLDTLLR
jgi:protein-disulfide isomerase